MDDQTGDQDPFGDMDAPAGAGGDPNALDDFFGGGGGDDNNNGFGDGDANRNDTNDTNDNDNDDDNSTQVRGNETYTSKPQQTTTTTEVDDDGFGGDDFGFGGADDSKQTEATDADGVTATATGNGPTGKKDDEVTFLSVWQERRRKTLQEQAEKERADKGENEQRALNEIQEFYQQRSAQLEAKREENKNKEVTLKEDINSTFEHGTIWEQVNKMVNLTEPKNKGAASVNPTDDVERMRALLIHLKNAKK